MGAGDVDRLGVGAVGVAGVDDADRRHVHRRAAVDDVADAGLAGVDVAVVQAGHEPLLGEEDALQEQRLGLQLGDPAPLVDQQRDEVLGDGVGVEVVAHRRVHVDQGVGHQRVVGDVAVALVVRGDRPGVAPVLVERRDDARDVAAVARLDLVGRVALGGAAEGVADGGAGEARRPPVRRARRPVAAVAGGRRRSDAPAAGPCRGDRQPPATCSQPSVSWACRSSRLIWSAKYCWSAGVAIWSFHCG